ncbi:MAG: hypothetical protein IT564_12795 [Rhodospirillales bacterium]|nr:hypothetical protein [Rhodospirillales bacterium]
MCQPFGCGVDDECRVARQDTNENGRLDPYDRDDNPEGDRLVFDTESAAVCNPVTYRCDNPGTAGVAAGAMCDRDSQCEANGDCLTAFGPGWPGGYCTKFGCDITGRGCAEPTDGSSVVCQERGIGAPVCLTGCTVGAEIDSEEMDELGPEGHGVGCRPGYTCVWNGEDGEGEEDNGACVLGEYNDVTEPNVGAACEDEATCYSPFGAARCLANAAFGAQGYCTVFDCAAPGLPSDICGADATCVVVSRNGTTLCLAECAAPADCVAEGEDANGLGCVDYDGVASTAKVCFPACLTTADCQEGFECQVPSGTTTGSCRPA